MQLQGQYRIAGVRAGWDSLKVAYSNGESDAFLYGGYSLLLKIVGILSVFRFAILLLNEAVLLSLEEPG